MKNSFGNNITVTLFGESHGECIGAVVDGLAPGIKIDFDYINKKMALRRPSGKISTGRVEADEYKIVSGEFCGFTTGTPLTVIIPNTNVRSGDYSSLKDKPRPSHADYTAEVKYHGYQDPRGGGHFSGRITAPLVFVGSLIEAALKNKGIYIGSHISELNGIKDRSFSDIDGDIRYLDDKLFPVLSKEAEDDMKRCIEKVAENKDSVGGVLECAVTGVAAGVGEPWFDTVEGMLSHALFSIPAVKGVEFGSGFGFKDALGSEANDEFAYQGEKLITTSNNNGGINGGITNGMPIVFRVAVKPTPSIFKEQKTVSLKNRENTLLTIEGRHDPAIIHRARAVVDSVTAIVIADMLTGRFGTDYLK